LDEDRRSNKDKHNKWYVPVYHVQKAKVPDQAYPEVENAGVIAIYLRDGSFQQDIGSKDEHVGLPDKVELFPDELFVVEILIKDSVKKEARDEYKNRRPAPDDIFKNARKCS